MSKNDPTPSSSNFVPIITAIIGVAGTIAAAYFAFRSNVAPKELEISATQTAEVRLTQASSFLIEAISSPTPLTNTSEAANVSMITQSPTVQILPGKGATETAMFAAETSTNIPPTSCENSTLYTASYSYIYDKPGGEFLNEKIDGGTSLNCIEEVSVEPSGTKYYVVINPIDGKEVAIGSNSVTFEDPRTCFKLSVDSFPEKVGYLYFSYCYYCMSGTQHSLKLIFLIDALGGTSELSIPSIQTIYREGSTVKITTSSKTYLIVTESNKQTPDTYRFSDGSLIYQTTDNTSYNLSTVSALQAMSLQKVSCQESK